MREEEGEEAREDGKEPDGRGGMMGVRFPKSPVTIVAEDRRF